MLYISDISPVFIVHHFAVHEPAIRTRSDQHQQSPPSTLISTLCAEDVRNYLKEATWRVGLNQNYWTRYSLIFQSRNITRATKTSCSNTNQPINPENISQIYQDQHPISYEKMFFFVFLPMASMTSMTIPGGAAAAHGEGRLRHGGHVDLYPWCPRRGRDPGAEACTVFQWYLGCMIYKDIIFIFRLCIYPYVHIIYILYMCVFMLYTYIYH